MRNAKNEVKWEYRVFSREDDRVITHLAIRGTTRGVANFWQPVPKQIYKTTTHMLYGMGGFFEAAQNAWHHFVDWRGETKLFFLVTPIVTVLLIDTRLIQSNDLWSLFVSWRAYDFLTKVRSIKTRLGCSVWLITWIINDFEKSISFYLIC